MAGATRVTAPVTGVVGEIRVADGSAVKAGDIIVVQYVTKTETHVSSPTAGQVKLLVQKDQQVNQGDVLAEIWG